MTGGDDPYDDDVVLKKLSHPNRKLLLVTEGEHKAADTIQKSVSIYFRLTLISKLYSISSNKFL